MLFLILLFQTDYHQLLIILENSMVPETTLTSFDEWLNTLRDLLRQAEPALLDIFETYAAEAKFGRSFIDSDLKKLPKGSRILEVGAGAMILSCQLTREGYTVTALEPVGEGFSHFTKLRLFILDQASKNSYSPKLLLQPAETMTEKNQYDFAFSVYVMEHVNDVNITINKVAASLKQNSYYRFICPNYSFPYEPHFSIPTFFNKRLTFMLLKNKIKNDVRFPDPIGVWSSLNWISVNQLNNIIKVNTILTIDFNKYVLQNTFDRVIYDEKFSARRSMIIVKLAKILSLMRLDKLLQYIPAGFSPIIDCSITKRAL